MFTRTLLAGLLAMTLVSSPVLAVPRPERGVLAAALALPELQGVELTPQAVVQSKAGGTLLRLQQRHEGIPVMGASALVRVDVGARLESESLVRGLAPSVAGVLPPRAVQLLTGGAAGEGQMRLVVLPAPGARGNGKLAWETWLPSEQGGEVWLLDASSGALLSRRPAAQLVLGRVFERDPASDGSTKDLALPGLSPGATALDSSDGLIATFEYAAGKPGGKLKLDPSPGPSNSMDFLYDPPVDPSDTKDAFAAVNAYYHAARARAFFEAGLGLKMAGEGWGLALVVNARNGGAPLNAAFFTPSGSTGTGRPNTIALGQGEVDFALDPDSLVHEFTHYVSHNAIGFNRGQFAWDERGFMPLTGAIDEGMADYFAASMGDDPVVGNALPKSWRRDLASSKGRCPDDVVGEVHEDGRLIAGVAWEIRSLVGASVADPLLWESMLALSEGAQPDDLARQIASNCDLFELKGLMSKVQAAEVKSTLASWGLFGCGRELSLDEQPRSGKLLGLDTFAKIYGSDCDAMAQQLSLGAPFSYVFHPSDGSTSARISVVFDSPKSGELRWSLLVNRGHPITFHVGPGGYPQPDEADFVLENVSAQEGQLDVPLPIDGQTLYLSLLSTTCAETMFFLEASDIAPATGPGLGPRSNEGSQLKPMRLAEGARTGCGFSPPSGFGGWWLGLGLVLVALRRKGRR